MLVTVRDVLKEQMTSHKPVSCDKDQMIAWLVFFALTRYQYLQLLFLHTSRYSSPNSITNGILFQQDHRGYWRRLLT